MNLNAVGIIQLERQILDEFISEAKADEVGLWFIIARVRDEFGPMDSRSLKATTLQFVEQLLRTGEIVAGSYRLDRSGVEPWQMNPADVVSRISSEWDQLGWVPDIGEIAVFVGAEDYT